MEFGAFKATENINPSYNRIKEFGLEAHVFDIETYGFTVVPAEKVAPRERLAKYADPQGQARARMRQR